MDVIYRKRRWFIVLIAVIISWRCNDISKVWNYRVKCLSGDMDQRKTYSSKALWGMACFYKLVLPKLSDYQIRLVISFQKLFFLIWNPVNPGKSKLKLCFFLLSQAIFGIFWCPDIPIPLPLKVYFFIFSFSLFFQLCKLNYWWWLTLSP